MGRPGGNQPAIKLGGRAPYNRTDGVEGGGLSGAVGSLETLCISAGTGAGRMPCYRLGQLIRRPELIDSTKWGGPKRTINLVNGWESPSLGGGDNGYSRRNRAGLPLLLE